MGLSTKKSKTNSQETSAPNAAFAPNISDAASTFRPAYDKQSAIADSFAPGLQKAGGLLGRTIDGDFLDGNPYVDGMIEQGDREITDRVTSAFNPGGRWGSAYWAKALGQGLADNRTRLRFGNYNQERAYQNEAPGNLAGIAGAATQLPGIAASQYGDNTGGLLGRYLMSKGKSTTKSKGSFISQLAKVAQLAAAAGGG